MKERERLGSRLGFILLSAGCAIGIGNVWKFPYVAGQNGGAIFILFYLLFLAVLGIPVLCMEFATGRAAQATVTGIHKTLTPEKKVWRIHGWLALAGNFILMMFYTVVAGWMVRYFLAMIQGTFSGQDQTFISGYFSGLMTQWQVQAACASFVIILGFLICAAGVAKGLERVTKYMMLALLGIMVLLAVHALLLEGASQGLAFYLLPNWEAFNEIGPFKVITSAMNQAFFTLSLGIGSMAVFGSYIGKEHTLLSESVNVAVLDTFVAIVSGLIIIPTCFAYGLQVDAGPSLIFITLPNIFAGMPFGSVWGSLFFLFMTFAAFSTVLAVFENIIASLMDMTGWSRKKVCFVCCLALLVLSLPCAMGSSVLANVAPLGEGSTILDLEDRIVSVYLLPLGSLSFVIYCTWKIGWGWDNFTAEANAGAGLKIKPWMRIWCKYVLPVVILFVFVLGFIG